MKKILLLFLLVSNLLLGFIKPPTYRRSLKEKAELESQIREDIIEIYGDRKEEDLETLKITREDEFKGYEELKDEKKETLEDIVD